MHYVYTLLASRPPLPSWAVVAAWPLVYLTNHFVARALRAENTRQQCIVLANAQALRRGSAPMWMFVQVLYAAVVFSVSVYIGGATFVFLGAGLDVSLICILGLNVQAWLSTRAMARPDAVDGSLTLSTRYALRQLASRLFGASLVCLLLGLLLAQLALLGGGVLCAAAGSGYLRRASVPERR